VNITKPKFTKWRLAGGFVEVTDKEISEIKINSVPKNTKQKTCVKILKQLFASHSVIIGEYSPRLRLGEYLSFIDPERGGFGGILPEVMKYHH
jgi:hypothetical protein